MWVLFGLGSVSIAKYLDSMLVLWWVLSFCYILCLFSFNWGFMLGSICDFVWVLCGFHVGFRLGFIWVFFGFCVVSSWRLFRFYLGSTWIRFWNLCWALVGFYFLAFVKFQCGFYVGSICVLCWCYSCSIGVLFGFCLVFIWVVFWVRFGFDLCSIRVLCWVLSVSVLGFIWCLLGFYLAFIRD